MSVTQQYPQNEMSMFLTLKKELFQIKDGDILHNFNQINVLRISLWIGQALIAGSLKFTVTLPLSLVISENLSISILYICERNAGKLVYIYLVYLWKKRGKTCLYLSCIFVRETRENCVESSYQALLLVYSTARVCSLWARVCTVQGLPQLVQV